MHIPDAFLDPKTAGAMGAISAAGLGLALRQARLSLPARRVPLMGLSAAFVFAAQMLNFPVAAGTSGHLVGGVLAAVLLGPSAAMVVISAVLIVQALLFSDGGILALGANIFNMGLIGAVGGWAIYRMVFKLLTKGVERGSSASAPPADGRGGSNVLDYESSQPNIERRRALRAQVLAAAFASWCTIVLAAVACSAELAISGTVRWSIVFPTMTHLHMLIGVGEALITALVLFSIACTRPEVLSPHANSKPERFGAMALYGLLVVLGLALFATPFASQKPDGLDFAAEKHGFKEDQGPEKKPVVPALAAEYKMPGISNATIATSIAGGIGTIVMFALCIGLARILVPGKREEAKE